MSEDMTKNEIEKIYQAVKRTWDGKIGEREAFHSVRTMLSSYVAFMSYYRGFEAMKAGSVYKKSIGAKLTRCFLELILKDFKEDGLELALKALLAHIEHRQTFTSSCKMEDYKEIYMDFSAKLSKENDTPVDHRPATHTPPDHPPHPPAKNRRDCLQPRHARGYGLLVNAPLSKPIPIRPPCDRLQPVPLATLATNGYPNHPPV